MEDQLARDVSSSLQKSVKEIYSGFKPLSDEEFEEISTTLDGYNDSPAFYVDHVGSAKDVIQTIIQFAENRRLLEQDKGLVVTIDHVLLTKGKNSEAEKAKIDDLSHSLVELKKYFSSTGLRVIFIMLSQLNRDIQDRERVSNPRQHYPTMNDLFAASSVYQCSDYVLICHIPARLAGMGAHYGPPREGFKDGLPILCPDGSGHQMMYWHLIKERFGEPKVMMMFEDFKNSRVLEWNT